MSAEQWFGVAACAVLGAIVGPLLHRYVDHAIVAVDKRTSTPAWLVSALAAALFGCVAWRLDGWQLPGYLALTGFLVVLSLIDVDTKTLPRRIIYLMGAVGVGTLVPAAILIHQPRRIWWAALGAVLSFAIVLILHLLARGALGFGDVRLAAPLGWMLGWQRLEAVTTGLFLSFMLSGIISALLLVSRKVSRQTKIPFGPFLAVGALATVLIG